MPTIRPALESDLVAVQDIDEIVIGSRERASLLAGAISLGHCWLASANGLRHAGFAVMSPSFYARWFIDLVIVIPEARRQGVGAALIRHCELVCPGDKLFTSTNASNVPMQQLLATLRFVPTGYVDNLDEDDPEIIYLKRLHLPGK